MNHMTDNRNATVRFAVACAAVALAALCSVAAAGQPAAGLDPAKAGIAVYPGAQADSGVSAMLRESMQLTAAAFRTNDAAAKVAAFYEKQNGVRKMPGATAEQAAFSAGCKAEFEPVLKREMHKCGYQVTVQNPWMDMKTGKLVRDTLITIVKQ